LTKGQESSIIKEKRKRETKMLDPDIRSYEYEEALSHLIAEFRHRIKSGTSDPEKFLSITEIERLWSKLREETNELYTEMLTELLTEFDEREIIQKKKESIEKKE
jgi:hypothetical protein